MIKREKKIHRRAVDRIIALTIKPIFGPPGRRGHTYTTRTISAEKLKSNQRGPINSKCRQTLSKNLKKILEI